MIRHVRPQIALAMMLAVMTSQMMTSAQVTPNAPGGNPPAETTVFTHYVVPAISPVMRLPDTPPTDGRQGGEVRIILAQDEYEPGAFILQAAEDHDRVELSISPLTREDGTLFPADQVDLKVVKVWYQNGNAWFSYFADVGLTLVPELLLHDENLVRVDTEQQANYARLRHAESDQYVWISAPREIDVPFDPYTSGFVDADSLQPVRLQAGAFKQFILTVHATPQTPPGIYRGHVAVTADEQPPGRIPVAVKVLPFVLPPPKANHDLDKDYIVSLMGAWPRIGVDHPAFMPTLLNLRRHNLLHVGPNIDLRTPPDIAEKTVAAMKAAGFATRPIINGTVPWVGTHDGTPYTFDELMTIKRSAERLRDLTQMHFGHTDAAVSYGDEQNAPWVIKARALWRVIHEAGLLTTLAGHEHVFTKAGYIMDLHPTAGSPDEARKARGWNQLGHASVGFYANQHNGSENPAFVRRQHGLLGYLSGFDMINNYEFAYGPWNDRAYELYKPMVLAYPTSNGLVDTLAWEGFREGIDDIRYATKLRQLAAEAVESGDLDRVYAGRQARQWLALLDGATIDLNTARLEMIDKIEHLMDLAEN